MGSHNLTYGTIGVTNVGTNTELTPYNVGA